MSDVLIQVEGLGKKHCISHQAERQRYTALRDVIAHRITAPLRWLRKSPLRFGSPRPSDGRGIKGEGTGGEWGEGSGVRVTGEWGKGQRELSNSSRVGVASTPDLTIQQFNDSTTPSV